MGHELAPGGGWLAWLAAQLGLEHLVPYGAVLTPAERVALAADQGGAGVLYRGERRASFPVLPLQIFGVAYDIDLVLVSEQGPWDMHEYARISTPEGPVWLCKDARRTTKEQTIVADVDDIQAWLPEVPLVRKQWPVEVRDLSTRTEIDVRLAYENIDGKSVVVHYQGPMPVKPEARRNTSTMGHSQAAVAAVLDISHKAFARAASVTIDGVPQPLDRILGVVPFRLALIQTQGGLSVGAWRQRVVGGVGFETHHASRGRQVWRVTRHEGVVEAVQEGLLRTLRYRFREHDGSLELARATVEPWDRATPACSIQFFPPLPDAARQFDGVFEGRFVLDVNGQASHGVGTVTAESTAEGATYELRPTAPGWLADRPMSAQVVVSDDRADASVARVHGD